LKNLKRVIEFFFAENDRFFEYYLRILALKIGNNLIWYGTLCIFLWINQLVLLIHVSPKYHIIKSYLMCVYFKPKKVIDVKNLKTFFVEFSLNPFPEIWRPYALSLQVSAVDLLDEIWGSPRDGRRGLWPYSDDADFSQTLFFNLQKIWEEEKTFSTFSPYKR